MNGKTKHTPGPWDIHGPNDEGSFEIHPLSDEDGIHVIADVTRDGISPRKQAANARLIAAAPQMLEALEEAFDIISTYADHLAIALHPDTINAVIDKSLAAIRAAKGEA